jgi:hypothetical protein
MSVAVTLNDREAQGMLDLWDNGELSLSPDTVKALQERLSPTVHKWWIVMEMTTRQFHELLAEVGTLQVSGTSTVLYNTMKELV